VFEETTVPFRAMLEREALIDIVKRD